MNSKIGNGNWQAQRDNEEHDNLSWKLTSNASYGCPEHFPDPDLFYFFFQWKDNHADQSKAGKKYRERTEQADHFAEPVFRPRQRSLHRNKNTPEKKPDWEGSRFAAGYLRW